MTDLTGVRFRTASTEDAAPLAALHADSWRRNYRGAFSNSFLDGDLDTNRIAVWTERLREPDPRCLTILGEERGRLIGFAHTIFDEDSTWGALLDNLHVAFAYQRRGVASELLAITAPSVIERKTGLYLWVLEQNLAAQAFYRTCGAKEVGIARTEPPGGLPGRLNGSPGKLRYAWPDPSVLLASV